MASSNPSNPTSGHLTSSHSLTHLTKHQLLDHLSKVGQQLEIIEKQEQKAKLNSRVLVPPSPSPKKKSNDVLKLDLPRADRPIASASKLIDFTQNSPNKLPQAKEQSSRTSFSNRNIQSTSTLDKELQALRKEAKKRSILQSSNRTLDFSCKPEKQNAVKAKTPIGPIQFKSPTDDPEFLQLEPNSQIRLSKRVLSHSDFQDRLSDRHIVRINELYAIIQKLGNGTFTGGGEWNVPLIGDWVLIGVIGQKSGLKTTKPYTSEIYNTTKVFDKNKFKHGVKEDEVSDDDDLNAKLEQAKSDDENKPTNLRAQQQTRQFVTFKLIDLSSKTISNSGSGVLNMILFESDQVYSNTTSGNNGPIKVYRGGSGGAYEQFSQEQPGTVIAILNPKVLKSRPHQKNQNGPEALTITPQRAECLLVIGKAKDLGNCTAKRLDTGQECGNWCDLRNWCTSDDDSSRPLSICEYHLQRQVSKVRASRAEFFSGTSGMTTHTGTKFGQSLKKKSGDKWDSNSKTGFLSSSHPKRTYINGQITYICGGGGSANSSSKFARDCWNHPAEGERLDGLKRRRKRDLEEAQISQLLNEGNEPGTKQIQSYGAKCVEDARRIKNQSQSSTSLCGKRLEPQEVNEKSPIQHRPVFSVAAIRTMGFDPTASKIDSTQKVIAHKSSKIEQAYNDLLENCHKASPVRGAQESNNDKLDDQFKSSSKRTKLDHQKMLSCHPSKLKNSLSFLHQADDEDDDDDDLIILPPKPK
ncbi:hypothetical protein O181_008198 [Austropuccinia psidii MF-1]|uniref:Zinc finger Mcm10/DnaG-type domain-containing protein n=1 Tax=Austropuccinia psidii MF-1 TaxID=1389203 RepID=A0A9Q3BNN1_9BASI|nr:hypothetical protein [Austropuccinia psidii MF-1]